MKNICLLTLYLLGCSLAYSLDNINHLSNIENQIITYQQANYARDGSNLDGSNTGSFLDTLQKGLVNNPNGIPSVGNEFVMAHIVGPATVERIWCADVKNNDALLNFYFDGEITPRFSATISELFYQKSAVFDSTLSKSVFESSGGNILYASLNVQKDLIITTESNMYYQVSYISLPKDTIIDSWNLTNDNSQSELFAKFGTYPKTNLSTLKTKTQTFSLAAHEKMEIFNSNTQGTIEGMEMDVKDLNFKYAERIYDEGNVRKGTALFRMAVQAQADSLYLVCRMNKNNILGALTNSSANVYVDNQLVGTWNIDSYRDYHFWEDEKFYIPQSFYQGKNFINIGIQYQSGAAWNEFKYQTICDQVIVDELDIKNTSSQNSHNYYATGIQNNAIAQFTSQATARYITPEIIQQKNEKILDSLYISVYFDDEILPYIHAPLGLFFGAGTNDAAYMNALLMGNHQGIYYNYMTMPYWKNVKIELENLSDLRIDSIQSTVLFTNRALDRNTNGYLKAEVRSENKLANDSTDYTFLEVSGKGKIVALVLQGKQDSVIPGPYSYLEGDERIYIDDARTPFIYGTGMEDIFNGGFYFVLDEVCLPLSGMSNSDKNQNRNMYRIYLNDAIYFRKNTIGNVEHGPTNDQQGKMRSICFYYWQNDTTYILTDSIDIGNAISESTHQYKIYGDSEYIQKSSFFEGSYDKILVEQDGRIVHDSVEFILNILPNNRGVRLLRTFDYSIKNQKADIYVNDTFVGTWNNAGSNTIQQLREDEFAIPPRFTQNQSQIKVKAVVANEWSSLFYKVFTIQEDGIPTAVQVRPTEENSIRIYPNPTTDILHISSDKLSIQSIRIYQIDGKCMLSEKTDKNNLSVDVRSFPKGVYFVEMTNSSNSIIVKKFIVE